MCIIVSFKCLQECCLCCLRGGALKPTTNGKWCHVVCALALPEVKFVNIHKREPINVDTITVERARLVGFVLKFSGNRNYEEHFFNFASFYFDCSFVY